MYIRKEIANFIQRMPKDMKMPKHWRKFVNQNSIKYNLIIKHGDMHECTNCHKYFSSCANVGEMEVCPYCKNEYLIRNKNLKNYFKCFDLALIDNFENKIIIRYFEVRVNYNYNKRSFDKSVVEYARIIPEFDIDLVNNRYTKYLSFENVKHTKRIKAWRVFKGIYGLQQYYSAVYLDDLDAKLKGTVYEYSQLSKAINYLKGCKIDLEDLLEKAKYESFELLIKAGLYNLALYCPEKFNEKGNFEKRFGISKDFYDFMKKNNITYEQLEVLKLIKKKNIEIINNILRIAFNDISRIENASEYVNLIKLEEYSKKQENFSIQSYLDYLINMEKLNVPLVNNILFPEDFWQAHNESVKKVKIVGNKILDKKIRKRYEELSKNSFSDKNYIVRPAMNLKDMKNESKQQNNCVYKNYSESYASGNTDIYFLRKIETPEKSLITIEVNNKKVIQSRAKDNKNITKEEEIFIEKWENEVLKVA